MSKGGPAVALLVLMLVTGCSGGGEPMPSANPKERHALTAFQNWLGERTTARETDVSSLSSTQSLSQRKTSGVLDFRNRTGRITGSYTYNGTGGVSRTDPVEEIFNGGDDYVSYPPGQKSLLGGKPWRVMDSSIWSQWSKYEKALTYVHDEGPTQIGTAQAHRFTGLVDMLKVRSIARMPRPVCPTSVLAIDLYVDDRTGYLIRYDRRLLDSAPKGTGTTTSPRSSLTSTTTYSLTDFGVQAPPLTLPDPAKVEQRIVLPPHASNGATLTFESRRTSKTC